MTEEWIQVSTLENEDMLDARRKRIRKRKVQRHWLLRPLVFKVSPITLISLLTALCCLSFALGVLTNRVNNQVVVHSRWRTILYKLKFW